TWTERLGGRSLEEVTPADLEKICTERLAGRLRRDNDGEEKTPRPVTPATVNREFAFLKHLFNVAIRDGKTERNPRCQAEDAAARAEWPRPLPERRGGACAGWEAPERRKPRPAPGSPADWPTQVGVPRPSVEGRGPQGGRAHDPSEQARRGAPRPAHLRCAHDHLASAVGARYNRLDLPEQPREHGPSLGREGLPRGHRHGEDQGLPPSRHAPHLRVPIGDGRGGPPHDQGARRLENPERGAALRASLTRAPAPGVRAAGDPGRLCVSAGRRRRARVAARETTEITSGT